MTTLRLRSAVGDRLHRVAGAVGVGLAETPVRLVGAAGQEVEEARATLASEGLTQ